MKKRNPYVKEKICSNLRYSYKYLTEDMFKVCITFSLDN